ncbi:MAG: hypothetical protein QM755_11040 [Luteolibacter sp.]
MTPQEKINRLTRGNRAAPSPLAPEMLPVTVAPPSREFRLSARITTSVPTAPVGSWPEQVAIVPDTQHPDKRGTLIWQLSLVAFCLLTLGTTAYVWVVASH